ncbi:hypothetical protein ACFLYK_04520 [Candidatus Cloacimonadota bacterium]
MKREVVLGRVFIDNCNFQDNQSGGSGGTVHINSGEANDRN